jgi:outer membrane protein assembly factor BamB
VLKNIFLLLFCLLSLLKPLIGEEYHSERYKYHVKLMDDWLLEEDSRKKKVSMIDPERLITINVIGFYYPDTITANGLQKRRMGSIYDGWMNIFEREGTGKENDRAAVEESYIALYTKHEIGSDLKINEKMVAEYYFVRDQNAYVISLETYKNEWPEVQKKFKRLVKSFWVGEGDKPVPVVSKKEMPVGLENTQQGLSAENRWFTEATPEFQKLLVKQWERTINIDPLGFVEPVIYKDVLYTASPDKLMAMNMGNGKVKWSYKIGTPLQLPLLIQNDVLYFKKNKPSPSLYAVIAESGNILYKVPLMANTSAMSYIENTLFLIQNQALVALDPSTGKVLWSKEYEANRRFHPVGKNGKVVFIKNNDVLVVCNPKNGDILWEKRLIGFPLYSPAIHEGKLIVTYEKQSPIKQGFITAYNLDSGSHIWSFKNRMDKIDFVRPPVVSTEYLFVPLKVQELNTQTNTNIQLLTAFDVKNGDVIWQLNSDLNFKKFLPPVVSEKYLFLGDSREESFHILDLVTGEKVPHMFDDNQTESVKDLYYFTMYKKSILKWIKVDGETKIVCYR